MKNPSTAAERRAARSVLPRAAFSMDTNRPRVGVVICRTDPSGDRSPTEALALAVEKGLESSATPFRLHLLDLSSGPEVSRSAFRDLVADQLECLAGGSGAAGLALLSDRNEPAAGLLLGAARLNLPAIHIPLQGSRAEEDKTASDGYPFHAVHVLAEVMGLCLSGASTAPGGSEEQLALAEAAGRRLAELIKRNSPLHAGLTPNAFINALRADAALGGWSGAVVFLQALAHESGAALSLDDFVDAGRCTPHICRLSGGKHGLRDLHRAGGLSALFAALKGQWLPSPPLSGKSINELARAFKPRTADVLRVKSPYSKEGGMAVLKGNLAPLGAVFRAPPDLPPRTMPFTGPARVFDALEEAMTALGQDRIRPGDVLVVRREGPKGGPGLRSLAPLGELLEGRRLEKSVAVITDGWWDGLPCVAVAEMVSPEAADGGPLALIKTGDRLTLDPAKGLLMANLTDMDLKLRSVRWRAPEPRLRNGYWARYIRSVGPALEGAVLG